MSRFLLLPYHTDPVQSSLLLNTQLSSGTAIYTLFQPYDKMILTSTLSFMLFTPLMMFSKQATVSKLSCSVKFSLKPYFWDWHLDFVASTLLH